MLTNVMILAEPATTSSTQQPSMASFLPLFVVFGVFIYLFMIRPQKQEKQRQSMLSSIKKNDRVETIGGIIGTVTAVRDTEITIKVDESSNTKITFVRGAIRHVSPKEAGEKDA
ncbi:MAG: preprotein translocase subunit YajC [Phycisphaerales bacterium]|nr:preprotein translocase subunit YajC [Phycisphaerales bacterium]